MNSEYHLFNILLYIMSIISFFFFFLIVFTILFSINKMKILLHKPSITMVLKCYLIEYNKCYWYN